MNFVNQTLEGFEVDNLNKQEPVQKETTEVQEPPAKVVAGVAGIGIFAMFIFLFSIIWVLIGMIGFLMSLVCCFYNGTTTDKFVGILLAWVLGPFYWLYYIYNSSYCTRFDRPMVPQQTYY